MGCLWLAELLSSPLPTERKLRASHCSAAASEGAKAWDSIFDFRLRQFQLSPASHTQLTDFLRVTHSYSQLKFVLLFLFFQLFEAST